MGFTKKKVWVITAFLADKDEEGEDLNWTEPTQEYYADTYGEAVEKRDRLLAGEDAFYGNLIEHCIISVEPQTREILSIAKRN